MDIKSYVIAYLEEKLQAFKDVDFSVEENRLKVKEALQKEVDNLFKPEYEINISNDPKGNLVLDIEVFLSPLQELIDNEVANEQI